MEIGLLILGGGLVLIGAFKLVSSRLRRKIARLEDEKADAPSSCKETCDIHGKVGDPIRYDCGHDDAPEFKIDLWGEPKFHKKPAVGKLLCSECLLKEALSVSIRCGGCGLAIMPGDPISLCVDDFDVGRRAGAVADFSDLQHLGGQCGGQIGRAHL